MSGSAATLTEILKPEGRAAPGLPGDAKEGLFDRVSSLFRVIDMLPDEMSDEEVEGLMGVLPDDARKSLTAMLIPRAREGSLAFMKCLSIWLDEAKRSPGQGRKTFLVPFCFPPELVHAFDKGFPITSEVLSSLAVVALEGQGERYYDMALGIGLPDHICSSNAIEIGSMLGSDDFQPQAIINAATGSCDINAKTHELISLYHGIPQFILEKTVDDSERGRKQYRRNYLGLIHRMEEFLDEELTEEKLRRTCEKVNVCNELLAELWDLHKNVPDPVPNLFSLYTYGTRFSMWGTDAAIDAMRAYVDVSKRRLKEGAYPADREVARCLLTYTSYYFDLAALFNWMEEQGYSYLGDGLDLLFPITIDTSSYDSMVSGLAEEAWNMPMTHQVGGESMSMCWLEDALYSAKDLGANVAIYSGHHSCKQTWSVASIMREELMKRAGVPMLVLQGDSWLKRTTPIGVIQEQIDEFIKNVVSEKRTGKRKIRRRLEDKTSDSPSPREGEGRGEGAVL
ncbi:MAG: 2-hydroxyacyl-CoA dehydratase family protein [Actinobacteria bacterium]|nr:2-hydroxyacyl-CoA dehydratase family protein [Actinomycetota bacterium]MBU1943655.1 2-hydroxyacyl-CoA dehydratase family protein [Actinomycetota bacterium]MBU2686201.1 2-hydroxyacyl-CoA dehydratase family protein [Actinomycetota bacterium]